MQLLRWLLALLLRIAVTVLLVSTVAFWVVQGLPGDPAAVVAGIGADEETVRQVRSSMGLDRPPIERYWDWLTGLFRGDLGTSLVRDQPVAELISERLPTTLTLAGSALLASLAGGIAFALAARTSATARAAVRTLEYATFAFPQFWVGLMLIHLFAFRLGWFPMFGNTQPGAYILPTITLALPNAAIISRTVRGAMEELRDSDHVASVTVLGVRAHRILLIHELPLALLPATAILAIQAGYLLAGAIVVEQVFSIPGLGRLAVSAMYQRDLPVIQGATVVFACVFPFAAAASDLAAGAIWPHYRRI